MWQIVVNEARGSIRRHNAIQPDENPERQNLSRNGHGDEGDPLGVRRWIAALPPRQREAVFLRYFADLDYRTIAQLLDVEQGTMSATLNAAHKTLRTRLEATQ